MALAVASLVLTSYGPLWNFFGTARDLRVPQATAFSILSVSIGFLVSLYFQQSGFREEILEAQSVRFADLLHTVPGLDMYSFHAGDEALEELALIVPRLRSIRSTRIFSHQQTRPRHNPRSKAWEEALCQAIRNGMNCRDVVSKGNEAIVRERRDATTGSSGLSGSLSPLRAKVLSQLQYLGATARSEGSLVWMGGFVKFGL